MADLVSHYGQQIELVRRLGFGIGSKRIPRPRIRELNVIGSRLIDEPALAHPLFADRDRRRSVQSFGRGEMSRQIRHLEVNFL